MPRRFSRNKFLKFTEAFKKRLKSDFKAGTSFYVECIESGLQSVLNANGSEFSTLNKKADLTADFINLACQNARAESVINVYD